MISVIFMYMITNYRVSEVSYSLSIKDKNVTFSWKLRGVIYNFLKKNMKY